MRKIIFMVLAVFTALVIAFIGFSYLIGAEIDFIPDREGDIIETSSDANELISKSPFLSFLDGNIESCKWYFQVADISGNEFFSEYYYCYNGEVVLRSEYFDYITANYKWIKYDYERHHRLNEDSFVLIPMFEVSMIRDTLKSKQLYFCVNSKFFNDSRYYAFLDKENRTLYFYWYAL